MSSSARPANRLASETSPYLRQHAHNPVDWYPWGPEAFELARGEDKPVLLSVGYSACHWCHVMERESFENDEIAALMNRLFVSIKVDREERPDVDQIYMQAVQSMTGRGGWPMTVFLTPDGVPFYGGTYFPPVDRHGMPAFPRLLQSIADAYRTRRGEVLEAGRQLVKSMCQSSRLSHAATLQSRDLLVQAHLERVGVKVNIEKQETNTFFENLRKKDYEAALSGWSAGLFVDPSTLWHSDVTCPAGSPADCKERKYEFNFTGYSSTKADELMDTGLRTPIPEEAAPIWKELQQVIYEIQAPGGRMLTSSAMTCPSFVSKSSTWKKRSRTSNARRIFLPASSTFASSLGRQT